MDSTTSFRNVYLSATILAIANMGDAFLYAWLPSNYEHIGIPAMWVGVILSVNRFTRLLMNGWVAWWLSNKGIKTLMIGASIAASVTTASYGFISAVPLWILARVLWGISFSTLRIGNTLYSLEHPRKGMALGLGRALVELGPVAALLAGPLLLSYTGRGLGFLCFGLVNIAGVLPAFILTGLKTEKVSKKHLVLSKPSSFNVLVLINAFITEGLLVVILAKLIEGEQARSISTSLALVGLLLGYRRLALVLLSPLSGWLGDRYGFHKLFIYTTVFSAAGLLFILMDQAITGIVVSFTFSAMNAAAATGGAVTTAASYLKEISDNATWRDTGTASGAILGAIMLPAENIRWLILLLLVLNSAALVYHLRKPDNKGSWINLRLFKITKSL